MSVWTDLLGAEVRMVGRRYRTRTLTMGEGPPLVLLHGTGGHLENWARNIAPLACHFRVVAFDFLWHGRSQTEGFHPAIVPALVDQVGDTMDALGIARASIEGQSLGGWVAMRFALAHPERIDKLILTTTQGYVPDEGAIVGYVEPDWSQNLPTTLAALRDPSPENIRLRMARILANPARLTDEAVAIRQALYAQPALAAVQADFNCEYLGMGEASRAHVVSDAQARQVTAPTLVYWGDKNRTPPALGRHIAATIPNARFHCAADTGHWAQFESADEHNTVVADFLLDSHARSAAA